MAILSTIRRLIGSVPVGRRDAALNPRRGRRAGQRGLRADERNDEFECYAAPRGGVGYPRSGAGGVGGVAALSRAGRRPRTDPPPFRGDGDRRSGDAALRQGAGAEGAGGHHALGAPRAHPVPVDRGVARRAVPDPRQGRRRQGAGPVAGVAAPNDDEPRRIRGRVGRAPHIDGATRRALRSRAAVRHHLVPGRHPQIPASARRSAGRLVLSATVCACLALIFPGRYRQGAGAPHAVDPRRIGHRPRRDWNFRGDSGRLADLSICPQHQPHRCRTGGAPLPPPGGAADRVFRGAPHRRFRWRGCANWKTSGNSSPARP